MSTRSRIVLLATLFNLSFEFGFRGFAGFSVRPGLVLVLGLVYFAYFTIVEELIRRRHITNVQLLLMAFAFGLWPMTFLTGLTFAPPLTWGINLQVVFGVNIVWWGFTQGLVTFYFANRLVPRNWAEPLLGKGVLILAGGYLLLIHVGNFLRSPVLTHGPRYGYLVVLLSFFAIVAYLGWRLRVVQQPVYAFERSRWLDLLAFGSVAVFLFSGLVLARHATLDAVSGSVISQAAANTATLWTRVVFVAVLAYYLRYRKPISI